MDDAAAWVADAHTMSRDEQDRLSGESHTRAEAPWTSEFLAGEVVPLPGE